MKRMKRLSAVASILLFLLMMLPVSYTTVMADEGQGVRVQDDFYDSINHEWLNTAKIEAGKSTTSTFEDVNDRVTGQIKNIISNLLVNKNSYGEDSDEKKIINLYNNTLNIEMRNSDGIKPVKDKLDKIKAAQTIDDITRLWSDKSIINPTIQFDVGRDIKDASSNILYINSSWLSLGDADEYINPTESTTKDKELTSAYYNKILELSGYSSQEAKEKVDNMFQFEKMLAAHIMGKQQKSKTADLIKAMYNVYTIDELNNKAPNLNLPTIMKDLGADKASKIILEEPKWLEAFNSIYTQENLPLIKNYLEISNLAFASQYLSDDFENADKKYSNNLLGISGDVSKEEDAIDNVNSMMGMAVGKIYAQKYVAQETKENVEKMTKEIIGVYKKRISNLNWMSDSTKKNAIDKLDKLNIDIGYPKTWRDYSKVEVKSYENGGSLYDNAIALRISALDEKFDKLNKAVDKENISFKPQTVNAFYSPTENAIVIPAGIIQGHFYDSNASKEVNLGGIGVIIGHEISHAFDNTGAQYDADGNLNNWWTDEDYNEFMKRTLKVRDFYSQIEAIPGEKLDGNTTAGENIADLGGASCLLDILSEMDKPDYKAFFQSYAVTWRQITTKEYDEYASKIDVHSPNKVRVNAVLAQFQKFDDTYGIKEGDGMYIKPEDRVGIW